MTQAPQLRPLGPALGTEALGIDLSKPREVVASVRCGIGSWAGCGIGSWGDQRPSLGDYVTGMGPRGGRPLPERANVAYALVVAQGGGPRPA